MTISMIMSFFPISPTNLIISLACGLLWTRLVYVIDTMEDYKFKSYDFSLIVNKLSYSYHIPVSHKFVNIFLNPKFQVQDFVVISVTYNLGQFHLPPPCIIKIIKIGKIFQERHFSEIITYILIKSEHLLYNHNLHIIPFQTIVTISCYSSHLVQLNTLCPTSCMTYLTTTNP